MYISFPNTSFSKPLPSSLVIRSPVIVNIFALISLKMPRNPKILPKKKLCRITEKNRTAKFLFRAVQGQSDQ